jgi:hypothetical protein
MLCLDASVKKMSVSSHIYYIIAISQGFSEEYANVTEDKTLANKKQSLSKESDMNPLLTVGQSYDHEQEHKPEVELSKLDQVKETIQSDHFIYKRDCTEPSILREQFVQNFQTISSENHESQYITPVVSNNKVGYCFTNYRLLR